MVLLCTNLIHAIASLVVVTMPSSSVAVWVFAFYVLFPIIMLLIFRDQERMNRKMFLLQVVAH